MGFSQSGDVHFLKGVLKNIKRSTCDPIWSSTAAREAAGKEIPAKNKKTKNVSGRWRAFRHVFQCLSKWDVQAE
jgi:hypothetical protein